MPAAPLYFLILFVMLIVLLQKAKQEKLFLKKSKIAKRLYVSDEFWKQFEKYSNSSKKVMGLYEIENIDNQNICTIAINPK